MFIKNHNWSKERFNIFLSNTKNTMHLQTSRQNRYDMIDMFATPVEHFIAVVDKGHKNGLEIHALYSDGSIRIYNQRSGKLITILFARPQQALRLADRRFTNELPPALLEVCLKNISTGKNVC